MTIATSPLTLDDSAGTAKQFARLYTTQQQSYWHRVDTDLVQPVSLILRHETLGKGSNVIDRHNVRIAQTIVDGAGVPRDLIHNWTAAVPRSAAISVAHSQNLVIQLFNLLCDQVLTGGHASFVNLGELLLGGM